MYPGSTMQAWSPAASRFFDCCDHSPGLRWLHLFSSGSDFAVVDRLLSAGVRVTTSTGAAGVPLARSAIAGLLAISRRFPLFIDSKARRKWEALPLDRFPLDLDGQTIAIVCLGATGMEVARLAKAFGMQVVEVTRTGANLPQHCDEVHRFTSLEELAPRIDWLVLACTLTPQTRGLVDRAVLERLKPQAGLINVARGEIVDEEALCERLRIGALCGAYLDVFATEPLPLGSPLWDLPNVLLSPHNAALSTGNEARTTKLFLDNLRCYVAGEPLKNEAKPRQAVSYMAQVPPSSMAQ